MKPGRPAVTLKIPFFRSPAGWRAEGEEFTVESMARVGDTLVIKGRWAVEDTPKEIRRDLRLTDGALTITTPLVVRPVATWRAEPPTLDFGLVSPGAPVRRETTVESLTDEPLRIASTAAEMTASLRRLGPRTWRLVASCAAPAQRVFQSRVVLARPSGLRIAVPVTAFSSEPGHPDPKRKG